MILFAVLTITYGFYLKPGKVPSAYETLESGGVDLSVSMTPAANWSTSWQGKRDYIAAAFAGLGDESLDLDYPGIENPNFWEVSGRDIIFDARGLRVWFGNPIDRQAAALARIFHRC